MKRILIVAAVVATCLVPAWAAQATTPPTPANWNCQATASGDLECIRTMMIRKSTPNSSAAEHRWVVEGQRRMRAQAAGYGLTASTVSCGSKWLSDHRRQLNCRVVIKVS